MCGIAGIYAYHYAANAVDHNEMRRIRDHMASTEPEGSFEWRGGDGHIAFGRRSQENEGLQELCIEQTSTGERKLVIVFDGAISNHLELRASLEARGHKFQSGAETEVLLRFYAEKGGAMIERLRGTFAFALWDAARAALLLACDPGGAKRLYYADDGWTLRFASRAKALLAGSAAFCSVEPEGWGASGAAPDLFATYQDVLPLEPGCALWVDRTGLRPVKPNFSAATGIARGPIGPPIEVRGALSESIPSSESSGVARPTARVFALLTDGIGGHGGIAEYNRRFLSALAASNSISEVIVLSRRGDAPATALPAGIRQLRSQEGKVAYTVAALKAVVASQKIDVVFCGHLFMAPLAAALARLIGAQLWVQTHGTEAWKEMPALYRRSMQTAVLITAVSRYTRKRLLEWVDIDPTRVKVLPNTFNNCFRPGPKPEYLIDRYGARDKKVLMTVSRLAIGDEYKGHDRVIKALPGILAHRPEALYLVVGDGDDRPRLEALAEECRVADRVRFAGRVPDSQLPDHMRLADAFVMPSTGEGFGIAFLEAAASGVAIVAGNRDGSMDALCDGALGAVIDPDDCDQLVSAIVASLDYPADDGHRADRFNFERFSAHLEALLGSLLSTRPYDSRDRRESLIDSRPIRLWQSTSSLDK